MSAAAFSGLALVAACLGAFVVGALRARDTTRRRYRVAECLHELRGSLTAIQLGAEALEARANGNHEMASRVDAIRTQIERATTAVGDLGALTLSSAADAERSHELVELGEIVRRRAAAWDRLAFARGGGIELRWALPAAIVRADPKRLCQALDNLIANGLEHGGGVVTLEGRLEGGAVHVTVSDCGPGIVSLEAIPRGAWHAPHGHGLAIARRAVELHSGRLRVIPRRRGANIEIELPLARSPEAAQSGVLTRVPRIRAEARGAS